jgi:hypothetical protein
MLKVLKQVGIFVFLTSLSSAHTFKTGSLLMSSYYNQQPKDTENITPSTYRDRHQYTRPLHLSHMGNRTSIVRLELANHLPALPNNANPSIMRSKEEAIGTGADAGDLVAFKELLGLFLEEGDLGDFEEVKRLPLDTVLVC